jgi:hypothetical protein
MKGSSVFVQLCVEIFIILKAQTVPNRDAVCIKFVVTGAKLRVGRRVTLSVCLL